MKYLRNCNISENGEENLLQQSLNSLSGSESNPAGGWIYPNHIQIETVAGYCTAKCIMCTHATWKRKKEIMSLDKFKVILDKFIKLPNQQFLTLHGNGEPLLDKGLPLKIRYAKDRMFKGIGFATNASELSEAMTYELLASGLDTIICSIDGVTAKTHESIRLGLSFNRIKSNVLRFIELRNQQNATTKVLIRMIRQEANQHEWSDYYNYWNSILNKAIGDRILRFDIHNWGDKTNMPNAPDDFKHLEHLPKCIDLYDRIIIFASGDMGFCSADEDGFFCIGNVIDSDPIELYNSEVFCEYRKIMESEKILSLAPCNTCTILNNRETRVL